MYIFGLLESLYVVLDALSSSVSHVVDCSSVSSNATTDGRGDVTISVSSLSSQLMFLNNEVRFNVWTPMNITLDVLDSEINPVAGWRQNCSVPLQEKYNYQTSRLEVTALISDGNATFKADVLQIVGHLVSIA